MVKVAILARPQLATTGSSDCIRRLGAAFRTREERPSVSDPSERPWPSRQRPPKSTVSLRLTIQADTVVKEMSEETILKKLDDDLKRLDR